MPNPVVHFEVRAEDPDAARRFFGELFDWTFPEGAFPGYTYVETGAPGAIPGGIGPTQGGASMVTFFVGVEDVAATLAEAERLGGKTVQPATSVPGVTFGLFATPAGQVVGVASQDGGEAS
jgi:predicted enzyme related to lactoylglutathione lyase